MTNETALLWFTPTEWIAILTVVLAATGVLQTLIYGDTHRTTKVVERAYVDISHDSPGLQMGHSDIRFSVAVRNHGRTPAEVAQPVMMLQLAEHDVVLPTELPYGHPPSTPPSAFLMPSETFHRWELRPQFPADVVQMLQTGERILWLIGYVDYIDRFGQRYRSGYARRYIPTPLPNTVNNLVFELQPGYNYDVAIGADGQPCVTVAQQWAQHRSNMGLT